MWVWPGFLLLHVLVRITRSFSVHLAKSPPCAHFDQHLILPLALLHGPGKWDPRGKLPTFRDARRDMCRISCCRSLFLLHRVPSLAFIPGLSALSGPHTRSTDLYSRFYTSSAPCASASSPCSRCRAPRRPLPPSPGTRLAPPTFRLVTPSSPPVTARLTSAVSSATSSTRSSVPSSATRVAVRRASRATAAVTMATSALHHPLPASRD